LSRRRPHRSLHDRFLKMMPNMVKNRNRILVRAHKARSRFPPRYGRFDSTCGRIRFCRSWLSDRSIPPCCSD
jgi:hypothetical protein